MDKIKKLKILFAAAEAAPLAKVGGLADVVGSLPIALKEAGCDARICIPKYASIDEKKHGLEPFISGLKVKFKNKDLAVDIWRTKLPQTEVPVYLIQSKDYFSRPEIYGKGDPERFAFFCRAVLAALEPLDFFPDIIHAHDGQTALLPGLVKTSPDPRISDIKTVLTIHNLNYQSDHAGSIIKALGLVKESLKSLVDDYSDDKKINFLKQGILNADAVTTVSPTYAREILEPNGGEGLDIVLKERADGIVGILNGINTIAYDPSKDGFLACAYDCGELSKKVNNKTALQEELGLKVDKDAPLAASVSRLACQKGFDLFTGEMIEESGCQLAILGSGEKNIEKDVAKIVSRYPGQAAICLKFDEGLAHRIYAAADIFLMPSRFEPCGLGQMIAMRYGSLPIVRRTGGLADTVSEDIGFVFGEYDKNELKKKLVEAVGLYRNDPKEWKKRQLKAMKKDFSWKKSAELYLKLYKKVVKE